MRNTCAQCLSTRLADSLRADNQDHKASAYHKKAMLAGHAKHQQNLAAAGNISSIYFKGALKPKTCGRLSS